MTTKSPEPPKDEGSSTSSVPVQGKPSAAEPTTVAQPTAAPAQPAQPPQPAPPAKAAAPPAKGAAPPGKATVPPAKAPSRPPPPPRGGGGGAAVALAILSLLVAVGAIGIAIYSLDTAREANSQTAPTAPPGGQAAAAPTPTATRPPAPTAIATQPPAFAPALVRAELQLPAPDQCQSIYVDVDTPQVGVFAGHEFYLSSCFNQPSVRIDRTSGRAPASDNPTAEVCAAQLAGSPTTELVLQLRTGLTFCLLTNKTDAAQQRIPQKIGIVEVREIKPDGSVTVAVSTYVLPQS